MHTDNLVVNDGAAGQAIEGVAELLPHFDRKAATALVVKTINAVDPGALVVAAEQKEIFGVLDFVREQKTNDFQRLLAAVNVVAQKEVIGLRCA